MALSMWREVRRAEGDIATADLGIDQLRFRAIGKRGGVGHAFSSDDAKRAAKRGLSMATGLDGSTVDHHFDVLAQVHRNRFWLGLRLNSLPLAPQATAVHLCARDAKACSVEAACVPRSVAAAAEGISIGVEGSALEMSLQPGGWSSGERGGGGGEGPGQRGRRRTGGPGGVCAVGWQPDALVGLDGGATCGAGD